MVCSWTSSSTHVNMPCRPLSSASLLPAIRFATYSDSSSTLEREKINVGTRTVARTSLTSASIIVRKNDSAAPGLRLLRMWPTNQVLKPSSSATLGAQSRSNASKKSRRPQPALTSARRRRQSSWDGAQG